MVARSLSRPVEATTSTSPARVAVFAESGATVTGRPSRSRIGREPAEDASVSCSPLQQAADAAQPESRAATAATISGAGAEGRRRRPASRARSIPPSESSGFPAGSRRRKPRRCAPPSTAKAIRFTSSERHRSGADSNPGTSGHACGTRNVDAPRIARAAPSRRAFSTSVWCCRNPATARAAWVPTSAKNSSSSFVKAPCRLFRISTTPTISPAGVRMGAARIETVWKPEPASVPESKRRSL